VSEYYHHLEQDAVKRLRAVVPDEARIWSRPEERVVKGRAHQQILEVVADEQVDLVVMGVQGKGVVNRPGFNLLIRRRPSDRRRHPRGTLLHRREPACQAETSPVRFGMRSPVGSSR